MFSETQCTLIDVSCDWKQALSPLAMPLMTEWIGGWTSARTRTPRYESTLSLELDDRFVLHHLGPPTTPAKRLSSGLTATPSS